MTENTKIENRPIIVNCEGIKTIPELSTMMVDELYKKDDEILKFKMIDCGTIPIQDNMTVFIYSKDRIEMCPTIWDPEIRNGIDDIKDKNIIPFYVRFSISSLGKVTVDLYECGSAESRDTPTSSETYPIEAFLTQVGLTAFWQRHPIPIWKDGDDASKVSYISYSFWIYIGSVIKLLYTRL